MRVFELARELNIPSKDLIKRMKALAYKVEGNFNVLDDTTVAEVKSKMLEPVTRVEREMQAAQEEGEAPEQPRKRRIISARRSGEVRKIQESLGVSGPLPEDQRTREEVQPGAVEIPAPPAEVESPPSEEPAPAEGVLEPVAVETPAEEEEPAPGTEPQPAGHTPEAPRRVVGIPLPKPVEVGAAGQAAKSRTSEEWRDVKRPERKRAATPAPATAEETPDRGVWRDMRRPRRGGTEREAGTEDEWAKPRRRGDRRGRKAPKVVTEEPRHTFRARQKAIRIGQNVTVSDLASAIGVKASDIIKKLIGLGVMATVNDTIDSGTAELIAADHNIELQVISTDREDLTREEEIAPEQLVPRPPIITIMGHVDHGKTTLLDHIRSSHVASAEAGGITQHIGAYYVASEAGDLVFLDTPGHEAFTSLRQRGANVTDIVVLIVAADDGVMPQTVEAIDHAKAAGVPIIVAMNKIDRPNADPDRIKRQLMEHGLVPEEYGGDTVVAPISAKSGQGVDSLLELIHLQAELLDLKSTQEGRARGFVIESQMDRRRGPVATVIVQRGTVKVGDFFVAGSTYGRVRAMYDDKGQICEEALPAMPVEILGYNELPEAGDLFVVMEDDRTSRQVAEQRAARRREEETVQKRRVHLEDFLQQTASEGEVRHLNIVLKADTQGSLEALRSALEKEGNEQTMVRIIRAGVGGITETDVSLATTSEAVVIGFNVRSEVKASEMARAEGVDVKTYTIIYELIDDVHAALEGMLKPIVREEVIGHAEVRDVFIATKEGRIAGGYLTDGRLERNNLIRLYRDNVLIHTGTLNSLRRFKEDVSSVASGYEFGFRVANFNDVKVGDLLEAFIRVEETATLERAGRA